MKLLVMIAFLNSMQKETKTVRCSCASCDCTPWYAQPYANYGPATLEVPIDHPGPWFCSLTCAALATKTNVWTGKKIEDAD